MIHYFFSPVGRRQNFTKRYTAKLSYVKATCQYVFNAILLNSFKLKYCFLAYSSYARIIGMKSRPNNPENKDIYVAMFYLKISTFYMQFSAFHGTL